MITDSKEFLKIKVVKSDPPSEIARKYGVLLNKAAKDMQSKFITTWADVENAVMRTNPTRRDRVTKTLKVFVAEIKLLGLSDTWVLGKSLKLLYILENAP